MSNKDVTGFRLKEALAFLSEEGMIDPIVKTTSPPGKTDAQYDEDSRVLRQKIGVDGNTVELTVSVKTI
jgi:hypothetical protein